MDFGVSYQGIGVMVAGAIYNYVGACFEPGINFVSNAVADSMPFPAQGEVTGGILTLKFDRGEIVIIIVIAGFGWSRYLAPDEFESGRVAKMVAGVVNQAVLTGSGGAHQVE